MTDYAPPPYPGWIAIRKCGDGNVEIITHTAEGVTVALATGADMTAALRRWHARTGARARNDNSGGPDAA